MNDLAGANPDVVESRITPNISHEMTELLRLFSNPRQLGKSNLRASSQRATTTDLQSGQNPICMPAPARFTRKSKPTERMNDESSADRKSTQNESPCPSPQTKSLIPLDDPYDELLQTLMNWCELDHDGYPSDTSTVSFAQLNDPI
jgi:hypothetical protein